jgi:ketopantoate hydroxymethyltransferase
MLADAKRDGAARDAHRLRRELRARARENGIDLVLVGDSLGMVVQGTTARCR